MADGKLIVLEGVDGSGTTTQARLLCERMRASHIPVHPTAEPSQGPVGSLLRQALTGRVVVRGATSAVRPPAWTTMALLFAADRMDHLDGEIEPNLAEGVSVVCDRYDHSSVAYQSVAGGGPQAIAWIRELNRHARRPDLTLVLDVSPQLAAERRRARRGQAELFDEDDVQARLCAFYAGLPGHFAGERVMLVDGSGTTEAVAQRVWDHVRAVLSVT
jgi:dTMP kinase